MLPGDAGEATEFGEHGGLDFFGEDEIGELERRILVDAVGEHHRAREAARQGQILQLHETGGLGQHAGRNGLQGLIGPGRDHGDRRLGEELDGGRVAAGIGAVVKERPGEILEHFPGRVESSFGRGIGIVVDGELARVLAVHFENGTTHEVAARTALVGAVVDELAGVGLDPGDQIGPGLGRIGRRQLGRVIGEQHLAAAIGHRIVGVDGERVDLGIVREPRFLHVDIEASIHGTRRQTRIGGLEIVGLRIGIGLHGSDRTLGDGGLPGGVAGIDEVQGDAGIGGLESGGNNVGPEVEDVGIGRGVPVDPACLGKRHPGQQHHASGCAADGKHKRTTFHRILPWFAVGSSRGRSTCRRPLVQIIPRTAGGKQVMECVFHCDTCLTECSTGMPA